MKSTVLVYLFKHQVSWCHVFRPFNRTMQWHCIFVMLLASICKIVNANRVHYFIRCSPGVALGSLFFSYTGGGPDQLFVQPPGQAPGFQKDSNRLKAASKALRDKIA